MSRPIKYIAIALATVLVCAAVFGIAVLTSRQQEEIQNPGLYIDGQQVQSPAPAMVINGNEVSFSVYRHYYLLMKSFFSMYYGYNETFYENDPDGDIVENLKGAAESEILSAYAWMKIANERGIELTEEELSKIDATLAEQKATHGDAFEEYLHTSMLFDSEETYLEVTRMQKLSEKVQTIILDELTEEFGGAAGRMLPPDEMNGYVTARHILIGAQSETLPDGTTGISEEEKERARLVAQDLYDQLQTAQYPVARFGQLMLEFGEDPGVESNPDGYTFAEGEMVDIFYETAISLDVYEISQPVWNDTHNGWHVIMRMPLSPTGIDNAISAKRNEMLYDTMDALETSYADYYNDFEVLDIV